MRAGADKNRASMWGGALAAAAAGIAGSAGALPDLDVTYIERTPRYTMYEWCYDDGYSGDTNPHLCPDSPVNGYLRDAQHPDGRHSPDPGEAVTFTAHVKNRGDAACGPFAYEWRFDGATVAAGLTPEGLAAGAEIAVAWAWAWDGGEHRIGFYADPLDGIGESFEGNNAVEDGVLDLAFYIVFGEENYAALSSRPNPLGSYSAEDWIRWQVERMHEAFADSVFPLAPEGCMERVRIDKIDVVPNVEVDDAISCPHGSLGLGWFFDGRWGFRSDAAGPGEVWADAEEYADAYAGSLDRGLVHELGHQLGLIDEYRLVVHPFRNCAQDGGGLFFNEGYVTKNMPYYMGNHLALGIFSEHCAYHLNRALHRRRGDFGTYLWDIPRMNTLRVLDVAGRPLKGARVVVYQSQLDARVRNCPVFTGFTNRDGAVPLGGLPFGKEINNWGTNGLLFIVVEAFGQRGTAWLEILDFNREFWDMNGAAGLYEIRPGIVAAAADPANLARGRTATASSWGPASPPACAADGNIHTPGRAWRPLPGDLAPWWQVDLGSTRKIYKVAVYADPSSPAAWFGRFRVDVSPTGEFAGEETTVASEEDWNASRVPGKYALPYTFPPVAARFVRIASEAGGPGGLEEAEVFGTAPLSPAPPPGVPPVLPAVWGSLLVNEIFVSPAALAPGTGDANGDGVTDPLDDQFVELVNMTANPLDLGGASLMVDGNVRHAFPEGTVVPPGGAAVVFGGGDPAGEFGGAHVTVASSGGLWLEADPDVERSILAIRHVDGLELGTVYRDGYTALRDNTSRGRFPDVEGEHIHHPYCGGDVSGYFSPGVRCDGTPFPVSLSCDAPPLPPAPDPTPTPPVRVAYTSFEEEQANDPIGYTLSGAVPDDPGVDRWARWNSCPRTGAYSFAAQDCSNGGRCEFDPVGIAGYTGVVACLWLRASGEFEEGDYVRAYAVVDGEEQPYFLNLSGNGLDRADEYRACHYAVPEGASDLRIVYEVRDSSNEERIYLDDVDVRAAGFSGSTPTPTPPPASSILVAYTGFETAQAIDPIGYTLSGAVPDDPGTDQWGRWQASPRTGAYSFAAQDCSNGGRCEFNPVAVAGYAGVAARLWLRASGDFEAGDYARAYAVVDGVRKPNFLDLVADDLDGGQGYREYVYAVPAGAAEVRIVYEVCDSSNEERIHLDDAEVSATAAVATPSRSPTLEPTKPIALYNIQNAKH